MFKITRNFKRQTSRNKKNLPSACLLPSFRLYIVFSTGLHRGNVLFLRQKCTMKPSTEFWERVGAKVGLFQRRDLDHWIQLLQREEKKREKKGNLHALYYDKLKV